MKFSLSNLCTGKVHIECQGEQLQEWLQHTVSEKITLENTAWLDEKKVQMTIQLHDFYRIVPLIRKYRLRMRILDKMGGLFFMGQARKRKFFVIGCCLFFITLILMSSFIWRVEVVGNEYIPDGVIRAFLMKEGVFVGQLKAVLPEQEKLQQRLLAQIPDVSWIGYRLEGTRAIIVIVEKKRIETQKDEIPSYGPVHLIAQKQALIRDMKVIQGYPQVEVSDVVKKGQRLVSGIYGENGGTGQIVGARGKVLGEVWYETEVTIPMRQVGKVYTGRRQHGYFPYFGAQVLRIDWFQHSTFREFNLRSHVQPVFLFGRQLPFGLLREDYLETINRNKRLDVRQAADLAKQNARVECLKMIGKDGRILEEKILHQSVEHGKVYLKIHFDVIENIAIPQPIVQGE